jgi:hypothetical protein
MNDHPAVEGSMNNRRRLRAFTLVALLIVVVLFVVFQGIEAQLKAAGGPGGIVELELAFTPARAAAIIQAWPARGADLARLALWLDFLFIVGYAGGLRALLVQMAANPTLAAWARALRRQAVLPLAAALLDVSENICLLTVVRRMPATGPLSATAAGALAPFTLSAGVFASIKFALVGAALLVVVLAAAKSFLQQTANRTKGE